MRRLTIAFFPMLILVLSPAGPARGDEVLFLNGDRLSGKILKAVSGKLTIKTEGAGDVTVDMSKVKTFSTDAPVAVGVKEQPPVSADVGAGPDRYVQTAPAPGAPPQPVAIADISAITSITTAGSRTRVPARSPPRSTTPWRWGSTTTSSPRSSMATY